MGRPPIGERSAPLFVMRLPDELADAVKAYAQYLEEHEGGRKVTRSEAARRLIEIGLSTEERRRRRQAR